MKINIFVYGTLRPEGALARGHLSDEDLATAASATMAGKLHTLGAYPVMVAGPSSEGRVVGSVMQVDPRTFVNIAFMEMSAGYFVNHRLATTEDGQKVRCLVFLQEPRDVRGLPRLPGDDFTRQDELSESELVSARGGFFSYRGDWEE